MLNYKWSFARPDSWIPHNYVQFRLALCLFTSLLADRTQTNKRKTTKVNLLNCWCIWPIKMQLHEIVVLGLQCLLYLFPTEVNLSVSRRCSLFWGFTFQEKFYDVKYFCFSQGKNILNFNYWNIFVLGCLLFFGLEKSEVIINVYMLFLVQWRKSWTVRRESLH